MSCLVLCVLYNRIQRAFNQCCSSTAGSLFDSDLVLAELPTVLTGAIALIVLKAVTVGLATRVPRWLEPNRLEPYDAVKLSFLLSGGGEFAFVVLALAERLEVLPKGKLPV